MRIVGHCRFSWLGISDTGRELQLMEHAGEDAGRVLWNPRRMAVRFHLFETLLLPSLRAQSDRDFQLHLTTSKAMPQMYFDRLSALIEDVPMIKINATDRTDIGHALGPIVNHSIADGAHSVHFRIDDDDGLARDYVHKLRQISEAQNFNPGTVISFPSGVIGVYDGQRVLQAPSFKPYIAIGLAFVLGPDYRRDPFRVPHRKLGEILPSFIDPTFCAYHYTRHSANNTLGYGMALEDVSANDAVVLRLKRNHPALAEGADVAAGLDETIAQAFPFTSGAKLRADLARHAQFDALAEEMGFLGQMA